MKKLSALILSFSSFCLFGAVAEAGPMDVLFQEGLRSDDGTVQDRAIGLFKELVVPKHVEETN